MNTGSTAVAYQKSLRGWLKGLGWALPLFFLAKGLLWLALPFLSALYLFE